MDELQLILNRIRNLKQYKGLSEEELIERAKEKLDKKNIRDSIDEDLDVESLFIDKEEKKLAKSLSYKYLKDYVIETVSDKNTLKQLIQLEILHVKLNNQLNDFYSNPKNDNPKITLNLLIDSIHKNINEISSLKDRLGISKSKQIEAQSDTYRAFEILKKKFKKYLETNQGSRTLLCPHCQQMILLKIRMDKYDVSKHPFFKDRILYNKHLIEMYLRNKIIKEDIAKILECSEFYVDWLLARFPRINIQEPVNQITFEFNPKGESNSAPLQGKTN